ncbi:MAG: hypothetical protein E8D44_09650 [Nitrospira sp.]|nr:MAG: hypothetical protein E8D44_09650 [Nitrospira sp.]
MRNRSLMGGVFLFVVLSLGIALSGPGYSAEPEKATAKPKPSAATKPAAKKVTATSTKYQSAETAGKAPTCFGTVTTASGEVSKTFLVK